MKPKRFSSDRFNSRRPARLVASGTTKSRERLCSQAKISAAPIPPEVIQKSSIYTCSACQKPIKKDKYLLKACEKYWHEGCLKCDRCHGKLGELGTTFFQKSDMNLCRQDYLEIFGETGVCSVCEHAISASEMVMRARQNVYHLECFACQLCNQRFCVGDRFYLCENKIVCQYDYEEHILPIQESLAGQTLGSNFSGPQFRDRDSTLSKLATNVTNYREDTNGDPGTDEAVDAGAVAEIPGRELNFSRRKAELLIMDSCRDESAKKNELPSSALVEASDELTESDDRGDCATKDARA